MNSIRKVRISRILDEVQLDKDFEKISGYLGLPGVHVTDVV